MTNKAYIPTLHNFSSNINVHFWYYVSSRAYARETPFNLLDETSLELNFPRILAHNCHFCSLFSWAGQQNKGKGAHSRSLTLVITFAYLRNPDFPIHPTPFDSLKLLVCKTSTMKGYRGVKDVIWLMGANHHLQLAGSGRAASYRTSFFSSKTACLIHHPLWVLRWSVHCRCPWRGNWRFCLSRSAPLIFPPVVLNPAAALIDALISPQTWRGGHEENTVINVLTDHCHCCNFYHWTRHSHPLFSGGMLCP